MKDYLIFREKTASKKDVYQHLIECGDCFIPPLIERVNIEHYAAKIFESAITFEAWDKNVDLGDDDSSGQKKNTHNIFSSVSKVMPDSVYFNNQTDYIQPKLVGLVAAYMNDFERKIGYITTVSVFPDFYGKGVAKQLMEMCIKRASILGYHEVILEVSEKNKIAVEFYIRMGFKYFQHDAEKIFMKLEVKV